METPMSEDKGELRMLIAADHGANVVRIQFEKPIVWLAMDVQSAENFARLIQERVNELRGTMECEHDFETFAEAAPAGDGPDMTTAYRKCRHCALIEPL